MRHSLIVAHVCAASPPTYHHPPRRLLLVDSSRDTLLSQQVLHFHLPQPEVSGAIKPRHLKFRSHRCHLPVATYRRKNLRLYAPYTVCALLAHPSMSTPLTRSFLASLPGCSPVHRLCTTCSSRASSTSTFVAHERCQPARAQASVSKQLDCFICNPVYSVDYVETGWPAEFKQKRTPLAVSLSIPNIFPAVPSLLVTQDYFPFPVTTCTCDPPRTSHAPWPTWWPISTRSQSPNLPDGRFLLINARNNQLACKLI